MASSNTSTSSSSPHSWIKQLRAGPSPTNTTSAESASAVAQTVHSAQHNTFEHLRTRLRDDLAGVAQLAGAGARVAQLARGIEKLNFTIQAEEEDLELTDIVNGEQVVADTTAKKATDSVQACSETQ
jgi:hypothetical protein